MFKAIVRGTATGLFVLVTGLYATLNVTAQTVPGVTQSAAQTATITGGVLQADGTPVVGAVLRLDGPNAHLTTVSDQHGAFVFTSVPFGVYNIQARASSLGATSRSGITVQGDIAVSIQYVAGSTGLKQIARVSTSSSGAHINVTPASIASVSPSDSAFKGNLSWRELLDQIPGVTVGTGEGVGSANGNGNAGVTTIPSSPFQPVILSINGALGYETSTTFDGMPLETATVASFSPGNGVDLSPFPLALFETADVVRGPGADAPSIVDSVGGAFVLHAPGPVDKNSFEFSVSNDPYGGYNATAKLGYRAGKLSATVVYSLNNSPGPLGNRLNVVPAWNGIATVNGSPLASGGFVQYYSNPYTGNCYCEIQTTLFADYPEDTAWHQHDGGIGLTYQLTPTVTVQAFYMGSQSDAIEPSPISTFNFAPGPGYTGSLSPGNYQTLYLGVSGGEPILQAGSLFEEKLTAYLGHGVLRLAALQTGTYGYQLETPTPSGTYRLYGTGSYCADPSCTTTTPFVFNGTPAALTFSPSEFLCDIWSRGHDVLVSYDSQIGSKSTIGLSYVTSSTLGTTTLNCCGAGCVLNLLTTGNFTTDEYRLHVNTEVSDKLSLDASYYITNSDYHVPNPNNNNQWTDALFAYSAPRVSATWRLNRNTVIRGAAGGGFALPSLFDLVGRNGTLECNTILAQCHEDITNINLQPEKSFGWDVGTDMRLQRDTSVSLDLYRTDLYGQLFQSVNFIGLDPTTNFPIYAQGYLNLAHSRFEGINLSLHHDDVLKGAYWNAEIGFTRGYIISVPPWFYNTSTGVCDFTTGANCQNTYAIPNQNFNGEYQSMVPYANGAGTLGYRWDSRKYLELQANYLGNDNSYLVPAFMEFNASGEYPLTKNLALIATFRNITGIDDQSLQFYEIDPRVLAPSIAGPEFQLNGLPFGPRTVVLTLNARF